MRTKGSCRYQTYYKVEVWNFDMLVWEPIQRSYPTFDEAVKKAPEGQFRIQTVNEDGTRTFSGPRIK